MPVVLAPDPAADHPCLAPDPAALVAGRVEDPAAAAPGAGCPDHSYQRSGSVPVVLAPLPAFRIRQRIPLQVFKSGLIRPVPAACDRLPGLFILPAALTACFRACGRAAAAVSGFRS